MALATIDLPGGIILSYLAKTANYTIGAFDSTIDCTANSFTVTLPTAVGVAGRTYVVKNSGTGTITVDTTSSQTIDGAATLSLIPKLSVTLQSDGANWIINVRAIPYSQGTWTPVVTLVGGAGNTVPEYAVAAGTYTVVGRECFFAVELPGDGGDEGAGTGQINISLPFTASADQLGQAPPIGVWQNDALSGPVFAYYLAGSTTLALSKMSVDPGTGDTSGVSLTGDDQNNTSRYLLLQGRVLI